MVIKQQKLVSLEDLKMKFRAIYEDTVIISKMFYVFTFIYARVHSFIRFSMGFITPKILSAIEQEWL